MSEDLNLKNNQEIEEALKEFENDSLEEANSYKAVKFYNETGTPKMIQLVMKLSGGKIKKQRTAEYILIALIILMFGLSIYFVFFKENPDLIDHEVYIPGFVDQSQLAQ